MKPRKKTDPRVTSGILKDFHLHGSGPDRHTDGNYREKIRATGQRLKAKVILTDQILRWPDEAQERLSGELEYLFSQAFQRMSGKERQDWVRLFFNKPGGRYHRQAILFRDDSGDLVAASTFDCGEVEYGGNILKAVYLITTAILPPYQNCGLGQTVGARILTELQPDVLLTTCAQSSSLHSRVSLSRKGLVTGFEVYPRLEQEGGTDVLKTLQPDQLDFLTSVFKQLFLGVVGGSREDVTKAVQNLTPHMVRKNLYSDMFDFNPWEKNGREDKLAKALAVTDRDGVLVMFKKKD
jgi:hypothetical protein